MREGDRELESAKGREKDREKSWSRWSQITSWHEEMCENIPILLIYSGSKWAYVSSLKERKRRREGEREGESKSLPRGGDLMPQVICDLPFYSLKIEKNEENKK